MNVCEFFKTSQQRPNTIDLEDGVVDLVETVRNRKSTGKGQNADWTFKSLVESTYCLDNMFA